MMIVFFEIPRAWLCYYNFVTLSRCMMNVYMVWIIVGAALNVMSIFTIGLGGMINFILFPTQLVVMFFTGYVLWFKIGKYVEAKREYEKGRRSGELPDPEE